MAMVSLTLTSSSCTGTPHLRDASFSSYLNCSEEEFVCKLVHSTADHHNPTNFTPNDNEDGEIGVFEAEKYFNEAKDHDDGPRLMFRNSETKVPMKANPQPRTPSVCSGSSSWKSQSALLKNVPRNPPHRHKSLFTSIRCINCSCSDTKSVDIGAKNPKRSPNFGSLQGKETELNPWIMKQIQSGRVYDTGRGLRIEDGFSFPVLNPKPRTENEKPNKSLVMPWNEYDDSGSDASSDLFEIGEFRNDGEGIFLARNASGYAPSEASIEWSVVTASAVDFEDSMPLSEPGSAYKMSPNQKGGKGTEKRRSRILSGCKSHKAVMVAGDDHRTNGKAFPDPRMPYGSDSFGTSTRFQAEARRTSFDSRNRLYGFNEMSC